MFRDYLKQILEQRYFSPELPNPEEKHLMKSYEGRNVIWYGMPEQMIVVHEDDIEGMWGNVYDPEKFKEVVELIKEHEDKVEFECPYVHGNLIELTDIEEEQRSEMEGNFEVDYDGKQKPASTGDEDLDEYIAIESIEESDDANLYGLDTTELVEVLDRFKLKLAKGDVTKEKVINEIKAKLRETDEQLSESDQEALVTFFDYENEVREVINNKSGDLGDFKVQLRDGHHRIMGAIEAGESRVAVNLDKDDIERFKGHYIKV